MRLNRHVRGRYGDSTRPWGNPLGVFDNENVIFRFFKN